MKEITWDDVRKGDWLVVEQSIPPGGPLMEYSLVNVGEVVEHNLKWTILKYKGKTRTLLQKHGDETITRFAKKDFNKHMKENYG